MPYIGKGANGFGIRETFQYTATSNQTAFTGSDINSKTLSFDNGSLVDVLLNGITLKPTTDYNTSTTNTITLTSGATASDEVMIIVYDVFSLSDAMPKTGGTFTGAVTHTGAFTSVGIDDNADATAITIDSSENVGVANTSPLVKLDVTGSNSPPPTSGTSQTGSLRLGQTGGNGVVDMGFDTTNTQGWIQATNKANLATNYQLNLNPNGGDVYIGDGNLVVASGHGIDFALTGNGSGSMSSELFDDYEEGTWTATLISGGGITFSASERNYVKVGRLVYVNISCSFSGTSSNRVDISGLPFTSSDTSACTIFHSGGSLPTHGAFLAQSHSGHNRLSGGKGTDMTYSDVNGTTMRITVTYLASA